MDLREPVRLSKVVLELIGNLKPSFSNNKVQCRDKDIVSQEWMLQEDRNILAESELWKADVSWSCEAPTLRQMAVATPDKFTEMVAQQMVQHLRITDRQVTEMDAGMIAYGQLTELTLTGNYISAVIPYHLPAGLKILELCYNCLSDIEELNKSPPAELQHLGVGYNQISQLCMTPHNWKYLVSLDVSYNLLCNLSATAKVLMALRPLRTLQLMGNPLALVLCYRSYIIDSLDKLMRLDDADITVSDRQSASCMKAHCELHTELITTSELEINVVALTGLPKLEAVMDTDEVITRYLLHFTHSFVPDKSIDQTAMQKFNNSQNFPHIAFNGSDQHTADQRHFQTLTPLVVNPESFKFSPIVASYVVHDLQDLLMCLKEGIDMNLVLSKVIYIRDGVDESSLECSGRVSAKAGKTGQTTAQSGKALGLSKKVADSGSTKKTAKGKMHSQTDSELPGDGWHVSAQVESFTLATFHIDTAVLLETYQLKVDKTAIPFTTKLREKGMLDSEFDITNTENENALLSSIKLQVHFNFKQKNTVREAHAALYVAEVS